MAKQRPRHRHANADRRGLWIQLCEMQSVLALGSRRKQEEGWPQPPDSAV